MGEVIPFPLHRSLVADDPELEALYNHPMRSSRTPQNQSGLPALLILMPDGQLSLRLTPLGVKVLQKALLEGSDLPLQVQFEGGLTNGAECTLPHAREEDLPPIVTGLSEWFVLHTYAAVREDVGPTYTWSFERIGMAPQSSLQPYLWTISFEHHGGTWIFGTSRDLAHALEVTESSDLTRFSHLVGTRPNNVECFSVETKRMATLAKHLANDGYWIRNETAWCPCH